MSNINEMNEIKLSEVESSEMVRMASYGMNGGQVVK